jgi:hypothetical protein
MKMKKFMMFGVDKIKFEFQKALKKLIMVERRKMNDP